MKGGGQSIELLMVHSTIHQVSELWPIALVWISISIHQGYTCSYIEWVEHNIRRQTMVYGGPLAVWPDTAKLSHFGKILKLFGHVLLVYQY